VRVVGELGEILLVCPESVFPAIYRRLNDGSGGIALLLPCLHRAENLAYR
jgi:hypothetical protein